VRSVATLTLTPYSKGRYRQKSEKPNQIVLRDGYRLSTAGDDVTII
jgi:hypothetical protein